LQPIDCRHVADHANNAEFMMSEEGTMATGAPTEMRDAGRDLYGASGESLHPGSRSSAGQIDLLVVKQRPFTSALLAVVPGNLCGKIT
jgi:hypothetical protein